MTQIPIILDEKPSIIVSEVSGHVDTVINAIVQQSVEANKATLAKKNAKAASEKLTFAAITELLENPQGVSRSDLLAVSESENIISIVLRIRNKLKKDSIYTLQKRGKGDSTVYFLASAN
jgi:hypothetical protein